VPDGVEGLTEQQKACLRLVSGGMSSKEIAIELGLSPQTVDSYLTRAIAALGASNRRDAARMLAQAEGSQKSGSRTEAVAEPIDRPSEAGSVEAKGWRHWLRLPPIGGVAHDLTARERTIEALRVAVLGAIAMLALALLYAGTLEVLHRSGN
jgi:DNA-binding CsgD family transcriptional regulator